MKKLIFFVLFALGPILSFSQVSRAQYEADIDATIYTNGTHKITAVADNALRKEASVSFWNMVTDGWPLIQGINTYTANTVIRPTGTFSINTTGLFTIASPSVSLSGANIKMDGLSGLGAGKFLQTDASGNLSYASVASLTFNTPLVNTSNTVTINDAAADGSTKGASTFTASDFNAITGLISIDYTNGQAAATGTKGFLTSTDWNTFNNKQSALTFNSPLSVSGNTVSITSPLPIVNGGTNNSIAYSSGSIIFSDGTSLTQDNSNLFWDNSSKYLGIGTSTPDFPLDVEVSGVLNTRFRSTGNSSQFSLTRASTSFSSSIYFVTGTSTNNWLLSCGPAVVGANDFGLYNYGTASTALSVLSSNNFFGVNTSSPSAMIHAKEGNILAENTDNSTSVRVRALSNSDQTQMIQYGSAVSFDPDHPYTNANVSLFWGGGGGGTWLGNENSSGVYLFTGSGASSSVKVYLETSGLVGIGNTTVTPSSKLQVVSSSSSTPTFQAVGSASVTINYDGSIKENALTTGNNSFTTTAATDTVLISGAATTDIYLVQITGTGGITTLLDIIRAEAISTGLVVHRTGGGGSTSGLTYNWFRRKQP